MFEELQLQLSLVRSLVGELPEALPSASEKLWGRSEIPIALGRLPELRLLLFDLIVCPRPSNGSIFSTQTERIS